MSLRKSNDRGHADHGWLNAYHTFSFADYYDPTHMGYRSLRVINEDRINGGSGFGMHGHKDMEIITYMIGGALEHKDTMGNSAVIKPGEVQYMSAGSGVRHSEFNHYPDKVSHLLQIWILPNEAAAQPRYDQKNYATRLASGELALVVSPDGREGSIAIRQDAYIYAAKANQAKTWNLTACGENRGFWVQVIRGELSVNGQRLSSGDALAIENMKDLKLESLSEAEFLVFDLK